MTPAVVSANTTGYIILLILHMAPNKVRIHKPPPPHFNPPNLWVSRIYNLSRKLISRVINIYKHAYYIDFSLCK